MKIEVWADVVCPWCCIGQVRLTKALAGLPRRADVQVVHRAFQLDPGAEGLRPVREVLAARYGLDAARLEATGARVREIAASEGLTPFVTLDNRSGNTRLAHQLLTWAGDRGHGARAWDAVYRAYFCEGRDIFTREGLLALARDLGLDGAAAALDDPALAARVRADQDEARRLGATGVPLFVFDRRSAIPGAASVHTLRAAIEQALDAA